VRLDRRGRIGFLAVIAAQAAHSVEEYVFRLYEVFAPARFVSGLFSTDLARGFAIGNVLLVLSGAACCVVVLRDRPAARSLAWFWALLEMGNGISHTFFALVSHGYFPGVATAPLLIGTSAYLMTRLTSSQRAEER
jgi:hypothetical protein